MKNALIAGQDGFCSAELLLSRDCEVRGVLAEWKKNMLSYTSKNIKKLAFRGLVPDRIRWLYSKPEVSFNVFLINPLKVWQLDFTNRNELNVF